MYGSYFFTFLRRDNLKISILKSNKNLEEYSVEENFTINKKDFSSIILLFKVIIAALYAFGLGYSLFFFGDDYIKTGIKVLCILIITYIFIDFPYSFFKALFLPKVFNKDNISLKVNPYTLSIDISSNTKISKIRVIISLILPFIILAIIPTIVSYILEFNIYLYVIASASAIIASKDLICLILILKNYSKGNSIKLDTDELIFYP